MAVLNKRAEGASLWVQIIPVVFLIILSFVVIAKTHPFWGYEEDRGMMREFTGLSMTVSQLLDYDGNAYAITTLALNDEFWIAGFFSDQIFGPSMGNNIIINENKVAKVELKKFIRPDTCDSNSCICLFKDPLGKCKDPNSLSNAPVFNPNLADSNCLVKNACLVLDEMTVNKPVFFISSKSPSFLSSKSPNSEKIYELGTIGNRLPADILQHNYFTFGSPFDVYAQGYDYLVFPGQYKFASPSYAKDFTYSWRFQKIYVEKFVHNKGNPTKEVISIYIVPILQDSDVASRIALLKLQPLIV